METGFEDLRSFKDVRDFLFGLRNTGMKYGIERMTRLAAALGHPERSYPVIHVAGTNGKGSTCASIESIYQAAGYKTGLYTSPHLIRLNERIQVNREPIEDIAVVTMTRKLARIGAQLDREEPGLFPSFFEFMTAMAFLHFQEQEVDVAIIEVGLGGRLDATNVVQPDITAITSIALDHTHILGDSLEKIAAEKAGIIKEKIPLVLGEIEASPRAVIEEIARQHNCPVRHPTKVPTAQLPKSSLSGSYQQRNAAVAQSCVRELSHKLPLNQDQIDKGLSNIQWSGRWESLTLSSSQRLILDSTHNIEGIAGLRENLANLRMEEPANTHFTFIAGVLGRERAEVLFPLIEEYASSLCWIVPDQPRASAWDRVSDLWTSTAPARSFQINKLFPKPGTIALEPQDGPIIVTGSIYLIGEVITLLNENQATSDSGLQDDIIAKNVQKP